jgi:signal transduction histidine kinase
VWRRTSIAGVAFALGLFTLQLVRTDAAFATVGSSRGHQVLLVAVGWALALAAILVSVLVSRWPETLLLAGIATAWFCSQWALPSAPDAVFTTGLVLGSVLPVLVAHVGLHLVRLRWAWTLLAPGYLLGVGLLGLAPTLFYDPQALGCRECSHNLLLVHTDNGAWQQLDRVGLTAMCVWLAAVAVTLTWWLARVGVVRRRETALVVAVVVASLIVSLRWYWHSRGAGFLTNDQVAKQVWSQQAWILLAVAATAALEALRRHRGRRALAHVVHELSAGHDLEHDLAARIGDPSLLVAFPVEEGYVDRSGNPVDPAVDGRHVTLVRSHGDLLTAIGHRRGLDPRRVEELASAVALGLDNERLHAAALSQLREIRDSGRRLLEAGDAERRRLERDLHDGAQQSLVMSLLQVRTGGFDGAAIELTEQHLADSVEQLRDIAHGLHPLLLERAGLATALAALCETRPLSLVSVPEHRFEPVVEATVYRLVERCCVRAPATVSVSVSATTQGPALKVDISVHGEPVDLAAEFDRVATLDGECVVAPGPPVRVTATIPAAPARR